MENELKSISPATRQLIMIEIGRYGASFSVDKYFHLINAINMLKNYFIVSENGQEFAEKKCNLKLEKFKFIESFSKIKSYKNIMDVIGKVQPIAIELKMKYDRVKDKRLKIFDESQQLRRLSRKISPYLTEVYFIFNLFMELTNIQNHTISREYLVNRDLDSQKNTFERKKKTEKEEKDII